MVVYINMNFDKMPLEDEVAKRVVAFFKRTNNGRRKMKKIIPIIIFVVSLIATGILLITQFKNGLSVTGLNEPNVWGAYIASFTFSLGAGAGVLLLMFYLSITNKLNKIKQLKLSLVALAALALAGIFITLDLGRPERFYLFLTSPNFSSPLVWDFWVMNTLILISVISIITALKNGLPKILSIIFMVVTFVAYFITTEAFSGLSARINWNTPILNLIFIISALLGGFSLYYLFSDEDDELNNNMIFKIVFTVLLIAEAALFAMAYLNVSNLGIAYLIIGNVIPIVLIFALSKNPIIRKVIAMLVLATLWFKRSDIIFSGYSERWLQVAEKTEYISTTLEKLLVINIFLVGIFGFIVIFSMLNKADNEIEVA